MLWIRFWNIFIHQSQVHICGIQRITIGKGSLLTLFTDFGTPSEMSKNITTSAVTESLMKNDFGEREVNGMTEM
jgi:hypothetical protein